MAKQSQEAAQLMPRRRVEQFSGRVDAAFDSEAVWKDAKLMVSHEDILSKLKLATRQGPNLKAQAAMLKDIAPDPFEISGVVAFSHWLASRSIQGPKVRSDLRALVQSECATLAAKSLDEKSRGFLSLGERLRQLPLSDSGDSARQLGDLLPDTLLLRSGASVMNLRLLNTPPQFLDRMLPPTEIAILNPQTSADLLKGCTSCRPDPSSSKGGSKLCAGPNGDDWVECQYPVPPLPPTPEPVWEYFVQVANYWWTTFLGAWHGHASTKTVKTSSSPPLNTVVVLPWDVPELSAHVEDTFGGSGGDCFNRVCYGGCGETDVAYNTHEVNAGTSALAVGFPWGVESYHTAAGVTAWYCRGNWHGI